MLSWNFIKLLETHASTEHLRVTASDNGVYENITYILKAPAGLFFNIFFKFSLYGLPNKS